MCRATHIVLLCLLAGCATWHAPIDTSDASLRARATRETSRGVQVSAAVLSRADSIRMLGTDLYRANVQPVWIEVRNDTTQGLWLLRSGTDPDYFSPLEVAWSAHVKFGGRTNDLIDEHFDKLALRNAVPAGQTHSGILFTTPEPVTKLLNLDLLGDRIMIPFTLFVPVPDQAAGDAGQRVHQYAAEELAHCEDEASLRRAIEALPCCAATASGDATGDPLNLAIVGTFADIAAAMIRRGYRRDLEATSGDRVFGRAPGFLLRKQAQGGSSANWLRLWRAPIEYRGQAVFVAQVGRPIGGRFVQDKQREQLHPDVDEARNLIVQDFLYSGGLAKLGFARSPRAPSVAQAANHVGDERYYTDGLRAVLFFGTRPLTFSDVELLDWESLPRGRAAQVESAAARR